MPLAGFAAACHKGSVPRKRTHRPRPRPCPAPPLWSERLYVRIAPSDIGLFRFLLEAVDNLALFSVVDRFKGVLLLRFSPHQRRETEEFLAGAATRMTVERMERPVPAPLPTKDREADGAD